MHGNYLRRRSATPGSTRTTCPRATVSKMNFGSNRPTKAWKDIWGCGQGIGAVKAVQGAAELVQRLQREYAAARAALCG